MLRRWLVYLILLIVIALLAAGGGAVYLFCRSQPQYAGTVAMPGLGASVNVYRDEHGVPHIFAANMNDAARALGYIHASERLFQMEMQRRAGAGRLSEILGADMLDVDKFTRTLGLYRLAEESFQALSPDTQKFLDSYADGVNAWLETHRQALPPEFFLLGLTPEPWSAADSLVWGKLMALQLSSNYKSEVLRAKLSAKLSPEQIRALMPLPPPGAPVTTRPELTRMGFLWGERGGPSPGAPRARPPSPAMRERAISALDKLGQVTGLGQAASNEWVISGARTDSGKPILANDPHLGLEAPILWYLARIVTPELEIEGATVPGLPIVLLGQNGHIAWGFTTTGSDVQDLFMETVDPHNTDNYLTPSGPQPFSAHDEIIRVKDAPDVTLAVRTTRHGPVLSDIEPDLAALAGEGKVMALEFTALGSGDTTPEALMYLNRASDWQGFLSALQSYQAPPQNIVYADTAGNIGFVAAGLVPVRKQGFGLIPVDGSSGTFDWNGFIPVAQWPQLFNPPAGFAFNANNAIVGPDSAYFYGQDWEEPFRALRLQKILSTVETHSLDISTAMQADITSVAALQLLPYLLSQEFTDPRATQAIELLRGWDATMDQDRPEPLIFEAWLYELHQVMLADKAGDPLKAKGPFDALAMLYIFANPASWCGTPDAPPAANCNDVIKQAFDKALALLSMRNGSDMTQWRWGKEQKTILRHKFWSHIPLLSKLTDLSVASSGDFYTLDRGGSSVIDPEHPFARTHGAGFRGIYDLSNPANSRFMIATGESGHVFSQHYGDLVASWNATQSFTLTGTQDDLKVRGLPELILEPAN